MLSRLTIQNIALISRIEVDFSAGLNIVTGETGAGKSIIIDAINLALGARAEKDLLKHGESKARVELTYTVPKGSAVLEILAEQGLEYDENEPEIVVARELSKSDSGIKSVCRVNGTLVNIALLKQLQEPLLDVHGQHEHQSLLNSVHHIEYLDAFAGSPIADLREKVRATYSAYKSCEKQLNSLQESEQESARQLDVLLYQTNEIHSAKLDVNEEIVLNSERTALENGEQVMSSLASAHNLLMGSERSAMSRLKQAADAMADISEFSPEYAELSSKLSDLYYNLEDIAYSVRSCKDSFAYDPERLEEIECRLEAISTLKRKYGKTVAEVLAFYDKANAKLAKLERSDEDNKQLEKELAKHKSDYLMYSHELSALRHKAAEEFSMRVMAELEFVSLRGAEFSVSFTELEGEVPSQNGTERIEFLLSANVGEPKKPLSKVASGGEVSRIMLALKSVLSDCEDVSAMIFDEIDVGISGKTATAVGIKMHSIAAKRQVIAITHLPQIAVFADSHFLVKKTSDGQKSETSLHPLDENERVSEIARIMGDENGAEALTHARAMMNEASKY